MTKNLKRNFFLNKAVIFYILTILIALSSLFGLTTLSESQKKDFTNVRQPSPTLTTIPAFTPSKTDAAVIYPTIDPNPMINCGPFPNSKLTLKLKLNDCNNYTDCGFLDGKWVPMIKSECSKKQAEEKAKFTQSYQPPQNNPQTGGQIYTWPTTKYITCQTKYGTYQTPEGQCESLQKNAELLDKQWSEFQAKNSNPQPTIDTSEMRQKNYSCKNEADRWYQNQIAQYGSSSAAEATAEIFQPQLKQKYEECNRLYPY